MAVPLRISRGLRDEATVPLDEGRRGAHACKLKRTVKDVDLKLVGCSPSGHDYDEEQYSDQDPLSPGLLLWLERGEDRLSVLALYLGIDVCGVVGLLFAQSAFIPL